MSRETSRLRTAPTGLQTWARPQHVAWAAVLRLPLERLPRDVYPSGRSMCAPSTSLLKLVVQMLLVALSYLEGSTARLSPDRLYTPVI